MVLFIVASRCTACGHERLLASSLERPVDDREREAGLLEALIEEARLRARRRRRGYAGVALLVAAFGVAIVAIVERAAPNAPSTMDGSPAVFGASGTPTGTIALTEWNGGWGRTVLWSGHGLRDPGIAGQAVGWSPDGTRLLIQREDGLYVVRPDGIGDVRLTTRGGLDAAWSPDGRRVAFGGLPSTTPTQSPSYQTIYTVRANGTGLRRIAGLVVHGSFFIDNLTWSPDGKHILFAGRTTSNRRHWLYLVRADGRGHARPIHIGAKMSGPIQPTWSPDGSRIAFSHQIDFHTEGEPTPRVGIYVMNASGTGVRWIAYGHGPVWSPDGTKLAFRHFVRGNATVNADGTQLVYLPGGWKSPDSKLVASGGDHDASGIVLVHRADGSGTVRIVDEHARSYGLPLWQYGTAVIEYR